MTPEKDPDSSLPVLAGRLRRIWVLSIAGVVLIGVVATCVGCAEDKAAIVCLYVEDQYYYGFARLLCEYLSEESPGRYEFTEQGSAPRIGELDGAMDVLDAIADSAANNNKKTYYLGITQSDVAYYFFNGGHPLYLTPHKNRDRVVAIGKTFPEYLHVYSSKACSSHVSPLDHFESWQQLRVGRPGSGTLITYTNIERVAPEITRGIEKREQDWVVRKFLPSQERDIREPDSNVAWGQVLVAGAPEPGIETYLGPDKGCLLELSKDLRDHLASVYSPFYSIGEVDKYREYQPEAIKTIQIPALLVASKGLPREVGSKAISFLEKIDEDLSEKDSGEDGAGGFLDGLYKRPEGMGTEANEKELWKGFTPALISSAMAEYSDGGRQQDLVIPRYVQAPRVIGWELLIALGALLVAVLAASRVHRDWRAHRLLEIKGILTIGMVVAINIALFHTCLLAVRHLEYRFYLAHSVHEPSPYIKYDYYRILPKLLDRATSSFSEEDFFPESLSSQAAMGVMSALVIASLFFFGHIAVPKLTQRYWLPFLKGRPKMDNLERHFVICNWHEHAANVIRQLDVQEKMQGRVDTLFLVLTPDLSKIALAEGNSSEGGEETGFEFEGLPPFHAFAGHPSEPSDLARAKVWAAKAVIVFPTCEQKEADSADSTTAITVLNIQRLVEEHEEVRTSAATKKHRERPHVVVW
jgi:TRAP-type uncharacterized transport system substrate-binding protein